MKQVPQVPCPICKNLSDFAPANPWRPFCSERCKMIDLGAWASDQYAISTPISAPLSDAESKE